MSFRVGEANDSDSTPLVNSRQGINSYQSVSGGSVIGDDPEPEEELSAGDLHTIDAAWESLDYDVCENIEYRQKEANRTKWIHQLREAMRWLAFAFIGMVTGAIAVGLNMMIESLADVKVDFLNSTLIRYEDGVDEFSALISLVPALLVWVGFSVIYAGSSAILTAFVQPAAGGSGIPQLKSYLNGVRIRAFLDLDALFVKVFGTGLSVASGLAVGQEGPMVHCGAIVASSVAEGRLKFSKNMQENCCKRHKKKRDNDKQKNCKCCAKCPDPTFCSFFRNDHDKRDFVSAGGAAGIAAAFGTPITGVLFALEEGASFWNQGLTLRLLLASMTSTFTVFFINSILKKQTNMLNAGVFSFGNVLDMNFDVAEIPFIIIVGIFGGLFGSLFNFINQRIAKFRFHYLHNKLTVIMEPILVVITLSTVAFVFCFLFVPSCIPLPLADEDKALLPGKVISNNCGEDSPKARLQCKEGTYSAASLLFLQIPEHAARTLFLCEDPLIFEWYTLLMFFGLYFVFTCWCCGINVPSGIFVPNFLVGAAWGRLLGLFFYYYHPPIEGDINPGKYAVFGAAAQMAGVSRMTLTLTCMVAEGTGNVAFGLPVMIVCVIAKFIGDLMNEGIYEQYLELLAIPFLSFDPPPKSIQVPVSSVASHPVVTLRTVETVSRIVEIVTTTRHNGFPVVEDAAGPGHSGGLSGLLRRDQLCAILANRHFMRPAYQSRSTAMLIRRQQSQSQLLTASPGSGFYQGAMRPVASPDALEQMPEIEEVDDEDETVDSSWHTSTTSDAGRNVRVSDLRLLPQELSQTIDLRPFMNPAPYAVLDTASLPKVFRLFRGLGLRHLCVVNRRNEVVGIVTRKDLAVWQHAWQSHGHSHSTDTSKPNVLPPSEGFIFR